jgi:hypothetical protein
VVCCAIALYSPIQCCLGCHRHKYYDSPVDDTLGCAVPDPTEKRTMRLAIVLAPFGAGAASSSVLAELQASLLLLGGCGGDRNRSPSLIELPNAI